MSKSTLCIKKPSQNSKIAKPKSKAMYATYRGLSNEFDSNGKPLNLNCPRECVLLGSCYAGLGLAGIAAKKSESRNDNVTDWIKELPETAKYIRLNVSGDFFQADEKDNEYIDEIIKGAALRPEIKIFSYTHAPKRLGKELNEVENITVNASCDSEEDLLENLNNGWDCVKIVPENTPKVVYTEKYKQVVCPAQKMEKVSCELCLICSRKNRKDKNGLPIVVAFEAHSSKKNKVLQLLNVVNNDKKVGDV